MVADLNSNRGNDGVDNGNDDGDIGNCDEDGANDDDEKKCIKGYQGTLALVTIFSIVKTTFRVNLENAHRIIYL